MASAFAAIKTVVNGGIDNTNISASAAIAASKLAGYPTDVNKVLRGDGTWGTPPAGAMSLITDGGVLGADAATLADFTAISASFKVLKIIGIARCDNAAVQNVKVVFNNDTSAIYDYQLLVGSVSAASASNATAAAFGYGGIVPGTAYAAGKAAMFEITIPLYAETNFHKCASVQWDLNDAAQSQFAAKAAFAWRSTAAITRVTLNISTGNYKAGSHALLYGMG